MFMPRLSVIEALMYLPTAFLADLGIVAVVLYFITQSGKDIKLPWPKFGVDLDEIKPPTKNFWIAASLRPSARHHAAITDFALYLFARHQEKDMYGYAMVKHIESLGYKVEENTLYPLLRRLEKNGWIASKWDLTEDRPRKFYSITREGRALRAALLDVWKNQNRVLDEITKEIPHV